MVPAIPKKSITARQARRNVGKTRTVCGKVATATYVKSTSSRPTFLNLEEPYPRQIFTILIWPEYRGLYPRPPEKLFRGKTVCVKGKITRYDGTPQIVARRSRAWIPKMKQAELSAPSGAAPKPTDSDADSRSEPWDYYDSDMTNRAIERDVDRMMDDYDAWLDERMERYLWR